MQKIKKVLSTIYLELGVDVETGTKIGTTETADKLGRIENFLEKKLRWNDPEALTMLDKVFDHSYHPSPANKT